MADWRAKKAREDEELHERLGEAVRARRVDIYTDQRMLDFQGSPVHNSWDHLGPLLGLMSLALAILLSTGVAIGIVAMTVGALGHLLGIKHYVAWRIRARAVAYGLESPAHFDHLWHLGGMAIVVKDSGEPPCVAPRGDWRKFLRRAMPADGTPVPPPGQLADGQPVVEEEPAAQEILPP